jgi:hypothetical protein
MIGGSKRLKKSVCLKDCSNEETVVRLDPYTLLQGED